MFETLHFVTRQLRRVRRCLEEPALADFAPDGKSAADVSAMLGALDAARQDVLEKSVRLAGARGALHGKFDAGHDAAVRVHRALRSVYRRDPAVVAQLRALPKKDETVAATLARMARTSELWATLPPIPGTTNPFRQGAMTRAAFEALRVELAAQQEDCVACAHAFTTAQAALTDLTTELEGFTRATVTQGSAHFDEGTTQRAWLKTIPKRRSAKAPRPAVIEQVTAPAPGAARLEFDAAHGTRFTIQHQGPADQEYAVVAEGVSARNFEASGLAAGEHSWIVIPHNSRGTGPASKPARVTVAAEKTG